MEPHEKVALRFASEQNMLRQRSDVRPREREHEPHRHRAKQLATEVTQRLPAIAAEAGGVRVVEEGIQVRSSQAWLHARDPRCSRARATHTIGLCGVGRHHKPGPAARINKALQIQKRRSELSLLAEWCRVLKHPHEPRLLPTSKLITVAR